MFLSVEWAKRWLPAIFLLLSLFLPWWTIIETHLVLGQRAFHGILSFPWNPYVNVRIEPDYPFDTTVGFLVVSFNAYFYKIFDYCLVSALIVMAGLCGLYGRNRTRTLGGLVGIIGVVLYFIIVFANPPTDIWFSPRFDFTMTNPFFGADTASYYGWKNSPVIWFLSAGFYLALAGSLMLLSPLIRTLVERLRKQLRFS